MSSWICNGCRRATVVAVLAGVLSAAQEPDDMSRETESRTIAALLVPGPAGAQLCGKGGGGGHVNFRVDFGPALLLSINGAPGVEFDPWATYSVVVECYSVNGSWVATTRVVNLSASGALVLEQLAYPIGGAPDRMWVSGAAAYELDAG